MDCLRKREVTQNYQASTESSGEKTFASHPPNKGTDQVERDTCLTWFPGFLYQLLRSSLSIRPDLQLVISRWNLMARSSDGIYPRRPSKVVLGHQARSSGVSAEGIRGIPRRIRLLEEWLRMEWNGYLTDTATGGADLRKRVRTRQGR